MSKLYVQLGRYGDILGILPVLYNKWLTERSPQRLVVSRDHADLLDGMSYIDAHIFDGDRDQLAPAIRWAGMFGKVHNTQVNGKGVQHRRRTECFMRDSWDLADQNHRWDQLSLVVDRRDEQREAALVRTLPPDDGRPLVLVNRHSYSSPFMGATLGALLDDLREDHRVVDISDMRAHRLYDMLGVLDEALCLISVDTSLLHLADASNALVMALVNPSPWLGSAPRTNHIDHRPYTGIDTEAMAAVVRAAAPRTRNYVHVYPTWPNMDEGTQHRNLVAMIGWRNLPERERWQHHGLQPERNSTTIGDPNGLPYVRDLIEQGLSHCTSDDDAVVLANTDVGPTKDITRRLDVLLNRGAAFAYRYNHGKLFAPPTRLQNLCGFWDGGLDVFAFTRGFWRTHGHHFPDMVMGAPKWDLVYRDHIKRLGGSELHGCVFHEDHASRWKQQPQSPSNLLNEYLYHQHCNRYDTTRLQPWYGKWPMNAVA